MAESSVQVRFSADVGKLTEAIDEAKESLDSLKEHFEGLAELAGIGLSADAFKEWIAGTAEAGEALERTSAMLGASIPQVSELQAIAKLTGTDFDGLALSLERMQLKLTQTGRESSGVSQALKAMGIDAKTFAALPIPEQMSRLAEAFSRFADGPTKTAAAMELLGRNGAQMIPLLDRGKEGIEDMRGVAAALGDVLDTETAESFAKTNEAIKELGLAMEGLGHRSFAEVNQAVTGLARVFAQAIASLNPAPIQAQVNALASAVIGMAGHVEEFCLRVAQAWQKMEEVIGASRVVAMIDLVRDHAAQAASYLPIIGQVASGVKTLYDAGGAAVEKFNKTVAGTAEQPSPFGALDAQGNRLRITIQGAQSDLSELGKKMKEVYGASDVTVHAKPQMPAFQSGGGRGQNDELRAALIEGDEEVKLAQSAAKQRETILNEELKTKQITTQGWLTATKDALQDELQDTLSVYQREEGLAGLKASQIASLKAKELEAVNRYNEQILQAEAKATEQIAAQWQKMGDQIVGAFNSQLKGLLDHTTSWSQAMKNIGSDLVLKLIEYFDKMAVEWIARQLAMTTASVTGDATRTASAATASTASAAAQGTGLLATLGADAAKVFGGVFAFLAPVLGPAAAGPAAASEASVLAAGTAIPGAAIGGYVLSSGLANIHAGETIVPASLSQPYQGGAGQTVHNWNISAIDAQSFAAALANQGSFLARTVRDMFNSQPSLRPSY